MTRKMLTVKQVAERIGVSEGFVYDHSSGGKDPRIPHFKLGGVVRFDSDLLEEFIRTWTEKCYNRDLSRSSTFARSPNTCPEIVTKRDWSKKSASTSKSGKATGTNIM